MASALSGDRQCGAGSDGRPSPTGSGAASGVYRAEIARTPHLTLHGLKDILAARGIEVSHQMVWTFLRREGLRLKSLFALEQGRADVARRRRR